jgi:hypothetical protein
VPGDWRRKGSCASWSSGRPRREPGWSGRSPVRSPATPTDPVWQAHGAEDLAGRFVRVRARNFAMVQRRGVQIWGWSAETPDGYTPTVHQVLAWLAENDAHALAHLRQGTRRTGAGGPEAPC